jgi:hypothetical protein
MKKEFDLVGQDGNAYALMAYTRKAMKRCKRSDEYIKAVLEKAKEDDYYHLIGVLNDEIQKLNNEFGGYDDEDNEDNEEEEWD